MLKVGFGRIDIMPQEHIELGGYGNGPHRVSTHVIDPLFATCVAITDEQDNTLLLITMDLLHSQPYMFGPIREYITAETGIPEENILVACTHTHTGPDIGNPGPRRVNEYMAYANKRIPEAAYAALADRKEATVLGGVSQTENLNFVRHYLRQDGTVGVGTLASNPPVRHMADADGRLRLLRFCREEGQDILMMNWPCHPDMMGGGKTTGISADYIGALRTCLEVETDCLFAFFQGAGGNITPTSHVAKPKIRYTRNQYAKILSKAVLELLPRLEPVQVGDLKLMRRIYQCPIDHTTDSKVEEAKKIWDMFLETGDTKLVWPIAREHGYNSGYACRAVLQRAAAPETVPLELSVAVLGELAFGTAPCELFDTAGAQFVDNSPCKTTWMLAYCNGAEGYFPNHHAFSYGCYEVDTHIFAEGSAEGIADNLLDMIRQLT
ncbi:MAG: hypothetical protein J6A74_03990 [Oscillospiraceae bacterium]|nr:hypothetical protein [Oscillospiraceae bacterium]